MLRTNFVEEKGLKKRKGQILGPYSMMCSTVEDCERSTIYCNYCGTYIYNGHKKDCQAYDTKHDFMKQFR